MFQNVQNDVDLKKEDVKQVNKKASIFSNILDKKNILLYIISFMVATIGMGQGVSPFALAIVTACFAGGVPALGVILASLIGTVVGFGITGALNYILILLVFLATFFLIKPKYNEENRNEKIKLGVPIFVSTALVSLVSSFISGIIIYDILTSISFGIITFIFYKIFVNSLVVIREFRQNRAFSIEEVIGTSLLLAISVAAIGDFHILGFSICNILSILIVLVLGWKNGILIGTTSGVTIGVTLGIIAGNEPIMIAAYAISGMIAGVLNRFGKIGVIAGFILGNGVLAYLTNGNSEQLIILKEILIASIGLLAMPKSIHINIEEFIGKSKLLPVFPNNALNKSKETVDKLNTVSEAIQDMANTYKGVAATLIKEEDLKEKNKQIFITELLNATDSLKENMLYEDIADTEGPIVNEIFVTLTDKQEIKRKDLLEIFAKFNSYIIGFDDKDISKYLEKNVQDILKAINYAYKISKVNFVWEKKLEENKKNISSQLDGVSKAISSIAKDMKQELAQEEKYIKEKEEIMILLEQKQIEIDNMAIKKEKEGRFFINLFLKEEVLEKEILNIEKILTKILKEKIVWNQSQKTAIENELEFMSDDKYILRTRTSKYYKSQKPYFWRQLFTY